MASRSLNVKIPRLGRNRYGVFYVRSSAVDSAGRRRVTQHILHTKSPQAAKILALKFCLLLAEESAMSDSDHLFSRYELDIPGGKAKATGAEDHKRMLDAVAAFQATLKLQAGLAARGVNAGQEPPLCDGEEADLVRSFHAAAARNIASRAADR